MLDRFTSSSKWQLDMKPVFRPGVLYHGSKKKSIEMNDLVIDILRVFRVIMRKKENCLGSTIFSNCMKIN
jgi:hypothetical protein